MLRCSFIQWLGIIFLLCSQTVYADSNIEALDYKHKVASKVYKDLAIAIYSHQKSGLPKLEMATSAKFIAKYYPRTNRIALEEKAYNICREFGRDSLNALSFLLGHEFSHYIRNHPTGKTSSCINLDKSIKMSSLKHEQEADLYGLFTAYLAKYNAVEIVPKLLDKLYESYDFPNELTNYDPLGKRKLVYKKVKKEIKYLSHLYETGNWLTAIGDYSKAAICYQAILKEYKNYEILNNLAATYIMDVITLAPNADMPYLYPVELDLNSRLYKNREPYGAGFDQERTRMLNAAQEHLIDAISLYPNEVSAYINLACSYDLFNDVQNAEKALQDAKSCVMSDAQEGHVAILEGIIAAKKGNKKFAQQIFSEIINDNKIASNKTIAKHNLDALNGIIAKSNFTKTVSEDRINDKQLNQINQFDNKKTLPHNYKVSFNKDKNSSYSKIDRLGSNKTILSRTRSRKSKTKQQIGVGSTMASLKRAYDGQTMKVIGTNKGSFICIPEKGLVFYIDSKNKVAEWGMFSM